MLSKIDDDTLTKRVVILGKALGVFIGVIAATIAMITVTGMAFDRISAWLAT